MVAQGGVVDGTGRLGILPALVQIPQIDRDGHLSGRQIVGHPGVPDGGVEVA